MKYKIPRITITKQEIEKYKDYSDIDFVKSRLFELFVLFHNMNEIEYKQHDEYYYGVITSKTEEGIACAMSRLDKESKEFLEQFAGNRFRVIDESMIKEFTNEMSLL